MGFTERYKVFGFECCGECSTMIPRPFGLGIFCGWRYRTCTRSGLPFRSSCLPVQQEKEQQKKQFCRSRTARFAIRGKSALAELGCTTCSLQTVLREFLSCFPLILRAFPAFCLSVIRCADHKKRPFFIQQ